MKVSVIIPTFNAERWLSDQLAALAEQSYDDWELVVVDNGSTDDSRTVALGSKSRFARFKLVDASADRGAAHARNQGVLAASGEFLLFTDADDIVRQGWIGGLSGSLRHSSIVTGPVEHFVDEHEAPPYGAQPVRERPPKAPLHGVIGCNLGITLELFSELGGFDETLPFGWSDFDFGIRASLRGIPIGWAEQAIVRRRRPASARAMWKKEFTYGRGWTTLERRYPELVPRGWTPLLRRTVWAAVHTPYIALPDRRRGWIMKAAQLAGRVVERIHPSM